jgi:mRNA interferase MazF
MALTKGDVVLVPFPFTDLSTAKLRPAIVLWVETIGVDVTLCFISSQNLI